MDGEASPRFSLRSGSILLYLLALLAALICLAACGAEPSPGMAATADPVASQVALQQAVAATLTAEAALSGADMVSTQVAVARAAAATLTAESPRPTLTATPPTVLEEMGSWDLGEGFRLLMQEAKDDGQGEFGYHAWTPLLVGPEDAVVKGFNRAVEGFASYALDEFRQWLSTGVEEPGSTLWMTHTITFATDELISVLFYVDGYVMGAAHPFHYSHSLNYDTGAIRMIELDDLFLPGSDYLAVLSQHSLDDLERQGVLEWEEGALPLPENFQRWNLMPRGLLITFDEYTIAPYAAGPQSVLVPYEVLRRVADPEGPLGSFLD